MSLQHLLVVALAALAALYLLRRAWRTWTAGCSGGCCSSGERQTSAVQPLIPAEDLLSRARSGSRSTGATS